MSTPNQNTKNINVKDLSFEEAFKRLEHIAQQLDAGSVELEKAIELYSDGSILKEHCKAKLNEAKLKIEQIVEKENGSVELKKME